MIKPIPFSAADSSHAGTLECSAISGIPSANSIVAWPRPHQAPSRVAFRVPPSRSAATSEVTATRWSGSEA